jgi:hypothetical protein
VELPPVQIVAFELVILTVSPFRQYRSAQSVKPLPSSSIPLVQISFKTGVATASSSSAGLPEKLLGVESVSFSLAAYTCAIFLRLPALTTDAVMTNDAD